MPWFYMSFGSIIIHQFLKSDVFFGSMKVHEVPFYTLCTIMDPQIKKFCNLRTCYFSMWVHYSTLGLPWHLLYNPGPRCYFSLWVHDNTLGLPWHLVYNPGPRMYFSLWVHDSTLGLPWHLVYNPGPRIYFSMWVHDSTLGLTWHLVYNPGPMIYFSMWVQYSTLGLLWLFLYNGKDQQTRKAHARVGKHCLVIG